MRMPKSSQIVATIVVGILLLSNALAQSQEGPPESCTSRLLGLLELLELRLREQR